MAVPLITHCRVKAGLEGTAVIWADQQRHLISSSGLCSCSAGAQGSQFQSSLQGAGAEVSCADGPQACQGCFLQSFRPGYSMKGPLPTLCANPGTKSAVS